MAPEQEALERRIRSLERALAAERARLAAVAQDLERRVAERTAELEHERAQLALLLARIPVGIVLSDARSGDILMSNERVEEMLGHPPPPAEWLSTIAARAYHRDGRRYDVHELPTMSALRERQEVRTEPMRFECADGSWIVVEATALPIAGPDGTVNSILAIFDDVSERERRERAEREFVTNAAHELQSPIAAVLAAAEALQSGAKHEPRDRDRFIGHIIDACNRLARLTNALLVLARVETGAEEAKRELVPLAPLLRAVASATTVPEGVRLRVSCRRETAVLAHPGLLEQALANILSNAAKHTHAGRISVGASRAKGNVAIKVTDTGKGIAAADRQRITKRFVRAATDRDGFGLGLAIAEQAVRAMGGDLRIESEPGRGTTATIILPAATVISS